VNTRTDADRRAYRGRVSRQRVLIAEAADAQTAAFTAEDLARAVAGAGGRVGIATVYRAIAAMAAAGFVEQVGARDGAILWARCRAGEHHHHLVCEGCGRVEEIGCELAGTLQRASADSGFVVTRHELSLYGLCAACTERGAGR
jgi:Fur family ferric uptake transcriptional regulator